MGDSLGEEKVMLWVMYFFGLAVVAAYIAVMSLLSRRGSSNSHKPTALTYLDSLLIFGILAIVYTLLFVMLIDFMFMPTVETQ